MINDFNGFMITGITIAIMIATIITIIIISEFESMKWWQTALFLIGLGVMSAVFIMLGLGTGA